MLRIALSVSLFLASMRMVAFARRGDGIPGVDGVPGVDGEPGRVIKSSPGIG